MMSGREKIEREISNLCIIVLDLASLMARWQRVLLIRIARAANQFWSERATRESILINTRTLESTCRKLINKKKRPDGRGRHTCCPGSKQEDSKQEEDPSIWLESTYIYIYIFGICGANKKQEDPSTLLESISTYITSVGQTRRQGRSLHFARKCICVWYRWLVHRSVLGICEGKQEDMDISPWHTLLEWYLVAVLHHLRLSVMDVIARVEPEYLEQL